MTDAPDADWASKRGPIDLPLIGLQPGDAILEARWPAVFHDGYRVGLLGEGVTPCLARGEDGRPKGFHGWPLDWRNAWIAGLTIGREADRTLSAMSEEERARFGKRLDAQHRAKSEL